MREICGEVSVAESYRIETHTSRVAWAGWLFPTQEGVRTAADLSWPLELNTIRPSSPGATWVPVRDQYISQRLIDSGAVLTVSGEGRLDVQRPGTIANPRGK